ncbi:MAG: SseB family protein [Clostridia bacterium]|nr:SseB family protein [Clostridia bacterium]
MSKALADCILKLKENASKENKAEFVSKLIADRFFVPVVIETEKDSRSITQMGYYSALSEGKSYLLVFTSVEAMGRWKKDGQFLELGFKDVCNLVNVKGTDYEGVLIDHCGNSMSLKKEFLEKVKSHIVVEKAKSE